MKKRRFMITGIFVLVGILLIPIYLRSEAFHRFYDRRLRTRYLKNIHNDGEWTPMDGHCTLEEMIYFYDICAVVKVTDGMEDSLGEKWRKDPKQIWDASYEKINVEVEEYVFDKTGNYFETLVIRALPVTVWADEKQWRKIYAYTGERLFLFITVIGSGLCQAETTWGYIVTGNNYLVPLTDGYSEEMNSYGGRKKEVYKEPLLEAWEICQAERNYERAIYHAILQDNGEINWETEQCGYVVLKEEEKGEGELQVSLLFMKVQFNKREEEIGEKEEGVMELNLKKEGSEYKVSSYKIVYKEELDGRSEEDWIVEIKGLLKEEGYPSEEIQDKLWNSMGEIEQRIREEREYERFAAGHDKWE